jgi:hypothetical protein
MVFPAGCSTLPVSVFSLQVLIPSTFQRGQKRANAVTRAIAATANAPILSPGLTGARSPISRKTIPDMILIFLSILPTLQVILSPPVEVDLNALFMTKAYHEKEICQLTQEREDIKR